MGRIEKRVDKHGAIVYRRFTIKEGGTMAIPADKSPNSMSEQADVLSAAETFASICKALGHPARVRIVEHLKKMDRCICGEIVEILPLAQSTVSQHLKCLKQAGLIRGNVEGPRTCYCLDQNMLQQFKKMAASL